MKTLLSLGFTALCRDGSVYLNLDIGVILALYVDDLLLFCKNLMGIQEVKSQLQAIYRMKDLGEADICLGIQIQRDITTGWLSID